MRLYAIIRAFEIISEASGRLSDELESTLPTHSVAGNGCSRQLLSPQLRRRDAAPSLEDFATGFAATAGYHRARAW
jgi:hypothetical protein